MSDLNLELAKEEYVGLTNVERLALLKSKTETKLGWIQEGALKSLESIIAKGLWRDKTEDMKKSAKDTLSNPISTPQEIAIANAKLVVVAGKILWDCADISFGSSVSLTAKYCVS